MVETGSVYWIPVGLAIIYPFTFLLTFAIAIACDHIKPVFSYISDTGTEPPEMNVFAQLVNIGCLFYGGTIYLRYKQVEEYFRWRYKKDMYVSNNVSLVVGMGSVLGISIVANFQENKVISVHLMGAFLTFVCGSVWCCFQSYFTFKLLPHFGSLNLAYMRLVVSILGLVFYFGCQATAILAIYRFKGDNKLKWKPTDGGWEYRGISVVLEWLMLILFDVFMITFIAEFKLMKCEAPKISFIGFGETDTVEENDNDDDDVDEPSSISTGEATEVVSLLTQAQNAIERYSSLEKAREDKNAPEYLFNP